MTRHEFDRSVMRTSVAWVAVMLALAGCDGGNDEADAGRDGGRSRDSGMTSTDAGPRDAGGDPDAGPQDAGVDAGPTPTDGGIPNGPATSAQIATVRASADGELSPALPIVGAFVTFLKPETGADPAGFFVQGEPTGPAIFVRVDPASLTPSPVVGSIVSFDVQAIATAQGRREVTTIARFVEDRRGGDVSALVQDVSAATDLVSALNDYESELIRIRGTIAGAIGGAGAGHSSAVIATAGVTGSTDLLLRVPTTIATASMLDRDCEFELTGVMWRFAARAQVSTYEASQLTVTNCAPLRLLSAVATSDTVVRLTFSRPVAPASVTDAAAQFTFSGELTASAATVTAAGEVDVTTSAQTPGAQYTVTASGLTDTSNRALDPDRDEAMFRGFEAAPCTPANRLVINEIDYDDPGADDHEFVELYNPTAAPIDLSGHSIVFFNGDNRTEYRRVALTGTLASGGYLVVADRSATSVATVPDLPQYRFSGGIQNGAPDAVAVMNGNTFVDFVVYEGRITAGEVIVTMPAMATVAIPPAFNVSIGTDTDGVADALQSLARVQDGCDRGTPMMDWRRLMVSTPGAAN